MHIHWCILIVLRISVVLWFCYPGAVLRTWIGDSSFLVWCLDTLQFTQSGRLRVNMGNIYYKQQKYSIAIKMYRMALDQTPNAYKETRYRIMRNIGNAFMRLGQYQVLSPHPHPIIFLMSTSFPPVSGLFTLVMQNLSTSKLQFTMRRTCSCPKTES